MFSAASQAEPSKNIVIDSTSNATIEHASIEINDYVHAIQAEEVISAITKPTSAVVKGTPSKSIMKSKVTTSPGQPKFSKQQLMKLEPHQSAYLKYPVDCRVYYDFNPQTTSQYTSQSKPKLVGSFCIGRIKAIYLDPVTKSFVYDVQPVAKSGSSSSQLLAESQLAYATGTPVDVQFSKNEAIQEGEIMGYKLGWGTGSLNEAKLYTLKVLTYKNIAQMYEDVHEDMITYRKKSGKQKGEQLSSLSKAKPTAKASLSQQLSAGKKVHAIKRKAAVKVEPPKNNLVQPA